MYFIFVFYTLSVVVKSQVSLGVNSVQDKAMVVLTRGCAFLAGWISPASVRSRTSITGIRGKVLVVVIYVYITC